MLKLTKTGIGLLTKQYRSVLRKCWLLNLGVFALSNIGFASDLGFLKDYSVDTLVTWGYFVSHGYTAFYEWRGDGYNTLNSALVLAAVPGGNDYQLNMQIDGYFYQNEGNYRVLDISNISNAINSNSTSTVASSAAVNAVRELVPTNTNQLTNGAGFITKSVNDLTNYYTKSETYSRNEIANLDSLNYYYTFRVDENRTNGLDVILKTSLNQGDA